MLFQSSVLYATTFTTNPSQVTRRVLTTSPCPAYVCDTRVQNGYVLTQTYSATGNWGDPGSGLLVIRISDGRTWLMAPTSSHERWSAAYVTAGRLWMGRNDGVPPQTIQSVDLSALGAPIQD
jgi:hypothetical protein